MWVVGLISLASFGTLFVGCIHTEDYLAEETTEEDETLPIRLSEEEARSIRDRLRGLYMFLRLRPKLMDRRLYVGSRPPEIILIRTEVEKRSGPGSSILDMSSARPVCPYTTEWQLVYRAKDINDNTVDVFQPTEANSGDHQWFYTVTCDTATMFLENPACANCCRGINHILYTSKCMPKKSYVMALVKRPTETTYDWNWIQVDTSCSCAINDKTSP